MAANDLYAEVVFDRPLDHAYSFAIPPGLSVRIGQRVECPFGRGNTRTPGFVVGLTDAPPPMAAKPILRTLDDEPLLDDHLLKLTRWVADYYLCGWGQVLQAVVPAGVRSKAGTRATIFVEALPPPPTMPALTAAQQRAYAAIQDAGGRVALRELSRQKIGTSALAALVAQGLVRRFTERVATPSSTLDTEPQPSSAANRLSFELNADQQAAWAVLEAAVTTGGYTPLLLHGVTGSGKTELYLRALEEIVRRGLQALVLVPEISLTPQTIERFAGRGRVAVQHSHLSAADRARDWRRVAAGEVDVVVGARSAVFAPCKRLGLIVIDEEHESTFKQDSTPRYHARDVAVMRARLAGVPIVLGSATPSLESWHNAHREKGYRLISLPERVEARPLPPVTIIDQRYEAKRQGRPSPITPTLERAMHEALKAGGQIMLLLNRRGFETYIHCPACGAVAECKHCDLSLTYHRRRGALVCHYCGWETPPISQCPACQGAAVKFQGLGTEKLEEAVAALFPAARIARMDSDTMTGRDSHARTLEDFRAGRTQILLGTQMIAKGLDFPNVLLVGVVNADVALHLPDFRAAERTFQLLAQVAGRTGRGAKGGRVMIQTFNPANPAIALAAKHDYLAFAAHELAIRQAHAYPPYQRLARVVIRSRKAEAAERFAETLHGAFRAALARPRPNAPPLRLLGPAECPVFRLHGQYRFHFQVQSPSSQRLHEVLREALHVVKPPRNVEWQVDVDPHNMV